MVKNYISKVIAVIIVIAMAATVIVLAGIVLGILLEVAFHINFEWYRISAIILIFLIIFVLWEVFDLIIELMRFNK